jgi:hypothetical protein
VPLTESFRAVSFAVRVMPESRTPLSPSPSSNDLAGPRLPGIRLSDRLSHRLRRVVAGRPYLAGAIVVHTLLVALLSNVAAFDARGNAQLAAAEAANTARRIAQTQARDLQHRLARMEAIREELDPASGASPPAASDASPAVLATRAQALADAIDAADLESRAADLARLTQLSPGEARRKLAVETAAARLPPPPETVAQKIVRLERRARDVAGARRARLDAQREGLRVTGASAPAPAHAKPPRRDAADKALAHAEAASGSTGQTHVAGGIPRAMAQQLEAMVRLGAPQGRVGVEGAEAGLSVNREHVRGIADGRKATEADFGRDAGNASRRRAVALEGERGKSGRNGGIRSGSATQDGLAAALDASADAHGLAAVRIPGNSLDLTGNAEDGRHEFVRYASPPSVDVATLHTAAGRVFGAGGTYAERVYLDSWYVIGPFAGKGDESMQAAYPPEDDVDLDAVYPGPEGRTLAWRFTSRGFYPFIPPDRREDGVYYAWTELRVDADRDVWLSIAADDDSMMWLDERLVWVSSPGDKPWYHPPYYLRDELVGSLSLAEGRRRVHLAAGVHRLLFKLHDRDDRSFFSVVLSN